MMSIGQNALGIGTVLAELGGVVALIAWGKRKGDKEHNESDDRKPDGKTPD